MLNFSWPCFFLFWFAFCFFCSRVCRRQRIARRSGSHSLSTICVWHAASRADALVPFLESGHTEGGVGRGGVGGGGRGRSSCTDGSSFKVYWRRITPFCLVVCRCTTADGGLAACFALRCVALPCGAWALSSLALLWLWLWLDFGLALAWLWLGLGLVLAWLGVAFYLRCGALLWLALVWLSLAGLCTALPCAAFALLCAAFALLVLRSAFALFELRMHLLCLALFFCSAFALLACIATHSTLCAAAACAYDSEPFDFILMCCKSFSPLTPLRQQCKQCR